MGQAMKMSDQQDAPQCSTPLNGGREGVLKSLRRRGDPKFSLFSPPPIYHYSPVRVTPLHRQGAEEVRWSQAQDCTDAKALARNHYDVVLPSPLFSLSSCPLALSSLCALIQQIFISQMFCTGHCARHQE